MKINNLLQGKVTGSNFLCSYVCHWPNCNHYFELVVGYGYGDSEDKVSSQVTCPKCKNNLRTWKDAIKKEEL